jgi:hypothetical protein
MFHNIDKASRILSSAAICIPIGSDATCHPIDPNVTQKKNERLITKTTAAALINRRFFIITKTTALAFAGEICLCSLLLLWTVEGDKLFVLRDKAPSQITLMLAQRGIAVDPLRKDVRTANSNGRSQSTSANKLGQIRNARVRHVEYSKFVENIDSAAYFSTVKSLKSPFVDESYFLLTKCLLRYVHIAFHAT